MSVVGRRFPGVFPYPDAPPERPTVTTPWSFLRWLTRRQLGLLIGSVALGAVYALSVALTPAVLESAIRITHAAMIDDFGLPAPRLAVAGLNPHAGEGGAMGHEELDWIAPLIARLRSEGMDLTGPLPADTMFHAPARARWDAAICAYHDQALIPIKTLDFAGGVNVTLGLPFVRTSPDHGTAFDIAGKGLSDADSAIAALRMAWDMARSRGTA